MPEPIKRWVAHLARGESGFTLIEMIVVVGIIAVLAGVTTPSVIQFVEQGEAGAQKAEKQSVKTALQSMMAVQRIGTINSRSGETTVNDWGSLPVGSVASPLSNYLESQTTVYFYCYDANGKITRQDVVATPSCP
jgi:prepilin-type N-terminal cleavage/methylation domain-containing protein